MNMNTDKMESSRQTFVRSRNVAPEGPPPKRVRSKDGHIAINLNHNYTFDLNEKGMTILTDHYRSRGMPGREVNMVSDGKITMPLWEFAQIFGEHMYMGPQPPFKSMWVEYAG